MEYRIEAYDALCELQVFTVNGVSAEYDDFGDKDDNDTGNAENYGCGDMRFTPKPVTDGVLFKYGISPDEYNTITGELEEKLSFGSCGWCI